MVIDNRLRLDTNNNSAIIILFVRPQITTNDTQSACSTFGCHWFKGRLSTTGWFEQDLNKDAHYTCPVVQTVSLLPQSPAPSPFPVICWRQWTTYLIVLCHLGPAGFNLMMSSDTVLSHLMWVQVSRDLPPFQFN